MRDPPGEPDRVSEPLGVFGAGRDRDRDLADAEQVQHVELPRPERVSAAVRTAERAPEGGGFGCLRNDALDHGDPGRATLELRPRHVGSDHGPHPATTTSPSVARIAAISW